MKLNRIICKALAIVCALGLFCACQKVPSDAPATSGSRAKEVTIHTYKTAKTEPASSETVSSEPFTYDSQVSVISEDPRQDIPPARQLTLPDGFDDRISELMTKYSCNQSCDPTLTPCGCQPELEAVTDEDGNIITPRDRVVSIYYMDIESGLEYILNGSVHYPVASTVKIPFVIYIYLRIDSGEIDPEAVLTYEKRHHSSGTGIIAESDYGTQYTVAQLLELAITRSDNAAYKMLKELVTWTDFEAYLKESGISHAEDVRQSRQKLCAESAGVYGRLMAQYLTGGSENAETFKEDLAQTRIRMIRSHYPIYRKYGWADFSFHDIAYVDAPHPYVLAVLTNLDGAEDDVYELFREISYIFEAVGNDDITE